jgi:dTMP kinase
MLITFEGTEGAGKSTLIQAVAGLLEKNGYRVTTTREPGGSPIAEKIRSIILHQEMNPWTELFLYEASRSEHLHQTILPALHQGHIVLCDRFTDSSLAYQGMARKLDWKIVGVLNRIATQGLKPELTVFVDIDPKTGLGYAKDPNRFEAEGVAFQTEVRKGFLKAIREDPKRFFKIKARSGSPEKMAAAVFTHMQTKLLKKKVSKKTSKIKK